MEDYKEKWRAIERSKSDKELKQIAMDIYDGKIFCDRQCGRDVGMVFIPLMFMGPTAPTKPEVESSDDLVENRDKVADYFQEEEDLMNQYEKDLDEYEKEFEYYIENYAPSIGMVYEYISEAMPRSINGLPIFSSMEILNKEETEIMFEYFEKYKKIKEEFEEQD